MEIVSLLLSIQIYYFKLRRKFIEILFIYSNCNVCFLVFIIWFCLYTCLYARWNLASHFQKMVWVMLLQSLHSYWIPGLLIFEFIWILTFFETFIFLFLTMVCHVWSTRSIYWFFDNLTLWSSSTLYKGFATKSKCL